MIWKEIKHIEQNNEIKVMSHMRAVKAYASLC